MARYEFQEGASSKFWEIELTGAEFTVRWGRIGTAGQSQVKKFATPARAQAEHDKLVKEKVGKGYQLVGGAGAPSSPRATKAAAPPLASRTGATPPAPPPPAPAPTVPSGDLHVSWTDAGRRRVHPRPGSGFKAPRVDTAKRFAQVKGRYPELEKVWAMGEKAANAECRALMVKARERLTASAPKPPLVAAEEAAAGTMLAFSYGPQAEHFVEYWVGVGGVAFAVDALATAWGFDRPNQALVRLKERDSDAFRYGRTHGYRALRRHLAGADPVTYASALEVARRHAQGAPSALRMALAYLFPTEADWSRALAEECLAAAQIPGHGTLLLGTLSDARLADRIAAMMGAGHLDTTMCETPAQEFACTLVDALGPAALSPLRRLFKVAEGAAARRAFAEGLAQIAGAEIGDFFRPLVDDKQVCGIASDYFTRHPHLAQAALAGASAQKGSGARVAAAVLKAATTTAAPVSEAPASRLPPVLASPPWLRPRATASITEVADLALLPHEERVEAVAVDEEYQAGGRRNPKDVAWVRKEIDNRIGSSGTVNFFYLLRLPPDQAAERILHYPPTAWYSPEVGEMLGLVGAGGVAMLPALLHLFAGVPTQAAEVLARFDSPRVAPAMADAFSRLKKARPVAEKWLLGHPVAAAIGLIPPAVGPAGGARAAAGTALRWLASRGHATTIQETATRYGSSARAAVDEVLAQDPLLLFPARLPKLPSFWKPAALPRPRLRSGDALPLAAVEALGTMLAFSPADAPYAGLAQVKEACDPRGLADFAWDLFQAWLRAGAPNKESWAMLALGHLGDDESARRITPLLRAWPGESASARAVAGLDVLALIGTDVALMHLHGIALKVKFKALQERAQEKIAQIAAGRGMTDEELADRLVPDLGLDASGSRALDFGPRAFTVGFDEQLRPFVRDSAGQRLPDLPRPGKGDDARRAAEAVDVWKALKKDARTIASDQVHRLERALASRRRWDVPTWRLLLADHPVLSHVVRRLVWGVYTGDRLTATFRVAEDRSLSTAAEKPFALAEGATIGLAHPLEMEAEASTWGTLLAEYEILQPFPQAGRRSYAPTAAEKKAKVMTRAAGRKVGFGGVLALQGRGWRKGDAIESGVITGMWKPLAGGLRAVLPLEPGIYLGDPRMSEAQVLGELTVVDEGGNAVTLGTLDPIAFSEIVYDVDALEPA